MRITIKLYHDDMIQYTAFLARNRIWYEYRMEEHFLWRIRTEELTADQHDLILDYLNKQEVKQ